MGDLDLDAIRGRDAAVKGGTKTWVLAQAQQDRCVLLSEVERLRAERDRLRDGIRRHREARSCEAWEFGKPAPEDVGSPADKRLWALLDGEEDDRG